MGLAGCVVTIYALIASKRRSRFKNMKVEVEAEKPEGGKSNKSSGNIKILAEDKKGAETFLRLTLENFPVGVLLRESRDTQNRI